MFFVRRLRARVALAACLSPLRAWSDKDWVPCPPAGSAECVTQVREEEPGVWQLRADADKALESKMIEMMAAFDWAETDQDGIRQELTEAYNLFEAARHLFCAATFARCDPTMPARAVDLVALAAARVADVTQQSQKKGETPAELDQCDWARYFGTAAASVHNEITLRACGSLLLDWLDGVYQSAVGPFLDGADGTRRIQSEHAANRINSQKVPASAGYPALFYPPLLTPQGSCSFSDLPRPLFGGEAFGDVTWVDVTNLRTRHLSILSLLEIFENGEGFMARHPAGLSRVLVNIGANDGVCRVGHNMDPANCLIAAGYSGVLADADADLRPVLEERLMHRYPEVQLIFQAVTPSNVNDLLIDALAKRPGPRLGMEDIDFMKVDVDGLDCEIAAALVAGGWLPKVWHVEVNPLFPPPVAIWPLGGTPDEKGSLGSAFVRHVAADGDSKANGSGAGTFHRQKFVGCSLQALQDTIGPDYVLLHLEFENAVLVRRDLAAVLEPWISLHDSEAKWRIGYFCHPLARHRWPSDFDQDSLLLRYDFRLWLDPGVDQNSCGLPAANRPARCEELVLDEIRSFLSRFMEAGSYHMLSTEERGAMRSTASKKLGIASASASAAIPLGFTLEVKDPDCLQEWKGRIFEWSVLLKNAVALLKSWTASDGLVDDTLAFLIEDLAEQLNIDRAWTVFKHVVNAECPLGGAAVVVMLRWRCGSPGWEEDRRGPMTAKLFKVMQDHLPLSLATPLRVKRSQTFGRSDKMGCKAVLDRYLEAFFRRVSFSQILTSRWPIFELLSALHEENEQWPRAYP